VTGHPDGAWYEESFGCEYLELYAHRDAAEARADVEAIVRLLDPPRDEPLLDLCCGACRHLLTLREMGFTQLVGLDLSAELLEVGAADLALACTEQAGNAEDVRLVRSDMRSIPYESHFATVLSLFTSFGYFDHDEQNEAVFHAVHRALRPGGKFLIDYLNREYVIANLVEQDECVLGDRQVSNVRCLTDECRRVTKTMTVTGPSGEGRVYHESVRMYSEAELVAMLRRAGFVRIRTCGSLDGKAYRPESKRLIAMAERA
jgi:SAM-dependent methyltransferase